MNICKKAASLSIFSTLLLSTAVIAEEAKTDMQAYSPWQVRLRAIDVIPDTDSKLVGIAGKAEANTNIVPEFDISYYFTKNISAELILATTEHKAKVKDGASTTQLGSVWLFPPTLTAQYHFNTD